MMLSRKDLKSNPGSYNFKVEGEPETDRREEKADGKKKSSFYT